MSLTSQLSSPSSWVNQYFKRSFTRVTEFAAVEGPAIKALETRVPTSLQGTSLSRVGTAVDYNIRLEFGLQPIESSVITDGIARMALLGTRNSPEEKAAWAEAVMQCLEAPDEASDHGLAKFAILLAHLDAGFRSGGRWAGGMEEMAREAVVDGWSPLRLLDVGTQQETAEVMQLARLAKENLKAKEGEEVLPGPSFDGSGYVGGADADLIIGERLYDVKTTIYPRRDLPDSIRQLIGYTLLDWYDEYKIREVGIYFSRQGERVAWELEELIARTATNGQIRLSEFRNDFMELAMAEYDGESD